jgi:hypothetical protein
MTPDIDHLGVELFGEASLPFPSPPICVWSIVFSSSRHNHKMHSTPIQLKEIAWLP